MNASSAPLRWAARALWILAALAAATGRPGRAAASSTPGEAPAAQQSGNLLVNPGFEGPYIKQCCHAEGGLAGLPIDEVQVARGWQGWWYPPGIDDAHPEYCGDDADDKCQAWHRPEWREAAPFTERIREGKNAQKYFTFYSVHQAGMYQRVSGIPAGARVRFSIYMHAWSTNSDSLTSAGQDYMGMRIGIDPTGGTNPWSPAIVWSPVRDAFDVYELYSVEATAQGGAVTVFTHSQPQWGYKHNDIYLDDASLVIVGGSAPSGAGAAPAEAATSLPAEAAGTGAARVAWSADAFPPGSETYTVRAGDTLWAIAVRHELTVDALRQMNGISGNKIYIGQVLALELPAQPDATPAARPPAGTPALAAAPGAGEAAAGATGDLCVSVYVDGDGDGQRDDGEAPGLPLDLGFTLLPLEAPAGQAISGYRTADAETTYCFPDLAPADYALDLSAPAGYQMITPEMAPVTILPGAQVQVEVGLASSGAPGAQQARTRGVALAGVTLGGLLAAYSAALFAYRRRGPQR